MKKTGLFFLLTSIIFSVNAQQYALFNTKTMFDAFENPAQKAFTLDSSRNLASNFFLPNFGLNFINQGNAEFTFRKLTQEKTLDTKNLELGNGALNTLNLNTNVYVFTYRIFKYQEYHKELGFAWQVRSDAQFNYTNESVAIFNSFKTLSGKPLTNTFNNNGYQQTYHQFSFNYRENLTKQIAMGIKLSLLSGIGYNSLNIGQSQVNVDEANDKLDLTLNGTYRGSFLQAREVSSAMLMPFKNPGFSLTFGTTYTSKTGFFLMGNIKDLGFISWGKSNNVSVFNTTKSILNISAKNSATRIQNEITDITLDANVRQGFTALTNAKADFLISKTFKFYTPNFIVSKNLFQKGGDLVLVNNFKFGEFSASIIPTYNLNKVFMFGAQGMYQTPNFEFFLGSDNVAKTISQIKGYQQKNAAIGSGYNGGSVYMGIAIKFGFVVEHPQNMSYMPGIDNKERSIFKSIFGRKKKRN